MAILTSILLAAALLASPKATTGDVLPQADSLSFQELDRAEAMARYGHPNEMWRYRALRAVKLRQAERAVDYFRFAARYGDKFSQHALSLLYWNGVGTAVDRAQAYAWADLAAERGYRDLLLLREKIWMGLDAGERAQALLVGQDLYAQYGDAVARPRMAREMRKALARVTGSRVGFSKDRIRFMPGGAIDGFGLSARDYYADERWDAAAYWRGQDRQWQGRVLVSPPEQLPAPPSSPEGDAP